MTSSAYVFVDGIESEPVICGIVELDSSTQTGRFRYGQSYLQRADAFPLCPITLPLTTEQFTTKLNKGMFGPILDAGPDSWGKKLIYSLHTTKPKDALELVLAGSTMGVGALTFSLSRSASKPKKNKNTLGDITTLLKGKNAILEDKTISKEAKIAFDFGSSMGGARPKTLIEDNNKSYIAKFNRNNDLFDVCKVEHATMQMLNDIDITNVHVAKTKLVKTAKENVLLVERFDRVNGVPSSHFISANTIIGVSIISNSSFSFQYSYGSLAEFIMKFCSDPKDAHELFCRMVFNILMGNTDDHARNHGFVYSFSEKSWRLSPAYDVLPINNSKMHGIGIGDLGRTGSIENALSQAKRFGLKQAKALKYVEHVKDLTSQWEYYFKQYDVSNADIERLKGILV